jgi:hypothetical protein
MSSPQAEEAASRERKERVVAAVEHDGHAPSLLSSAVLIAIGALIEPELLVGMAIGAGIVYGSSYLPDVVGGVLRPLVKSAVKVGYAAAEAVSEAAEKVQDIAAEVRAEEEKGGAHPQS